MRNNELHRFNLEGLSNLPVGHNHYVVFLKMALMIINFIFQKVMNNETTEPIVPHISRTFGISVYNNKPKLFVFLYPKDGSYKGSDFTIIMKSMSDIRAYFKTLSDTYFSKSTASIFKNIIVHWSDIGPNNMYHLVGFTIQHPNGDTLFEIVATQDCKTNKVTLSLQAPFVDTRSVTRNMFDEVTMASYAFINKSDDPEFSDYFVSMTGDSTNFYNKCTCILKENFNLKTS